MKLSTIYIPFMALILVACNGALVDDSPLAQANKEKNTTEVSIEPGAAIVDQKETQNMRVEPTKTESEPAVEDDAKVPKMHDLVVEEQAVQDKSSQKVKSTVAAQPVTRSQDSTVVKTSSEFIRVPGLPKKLAANVGPAEGKMATHHLPMVKELYQHAEDNRENYDRTEISSIKLTSIDPVSTFSTDVDTASYTNARRFLVQGTLPPAQSVRVEEFINYFDYNLKSPKGIDSPLNIETELMQTPWNSQTQLMRVSLQAYRSNMDDLPPLNLVFLLDVSGSMHSPDKLPLMQRSFNLLVNKMRRQDHVSIVVYAGASGVVLEPTSGTNKSDINAAINQLRAGGSTHGSSGIQLAYQIAQKHFLEEGINRVILGTDGDFNVGTTNLDALKDLIATKRESGVFLNILGFGTGNYNDKLMEELSNHGNGVAYYIDSYQEARKIFSEQLTATLQTVAKDVKIQVEFNPKQVAEYRLIGYDNRLLKQEDFNNDKIDAGEIGSGHTVTALYEIVPANSEYRFNDPLRYQTTNKHETNTNNEVAFVKVRYKLPRSSASTLINQPVFLSAEHNEDSGSEIMQLSAAVAGFAELLRNSPYVNNFGFEQVVSMTRSTMSDDRWGYRAELLQLVKNAQTASFN